MPSEAPGGPAERLHPLSLLFSAGKAARNLLVPGVVVLYAARGSSAEIWLMLLFVPAVLHSIVRYASYRYRLEDEELVVREGIVTRNERQIPYARIQNIDLVQNPLHRIFGVAEVRLETAGGEKPEAVMRVLSLEAVERMRARVFAGERGQAQGASGAARARTLLRLSAGELIRLGLISNKGTVVVAAALGLAWQLDPWERLEAWLEVELPRWAGRLAGPSDPGALAWLALGSTAGLLVAMGLLSVAWAFLRFHGFRLTRRGEDLCTESGLLTRVSKTIPRQRIQQLSVQAGPLHRLFGRASVQVATAGSPGSSGDPGGGGQAARLWLAPLLRPQRLAELLEQAMPGLAPDDVDWQPLPARARRRLLRPALFVLAPLAGLGAWQLGLWTLAPAAGLALLAWVHARLWVRRAAWALGEDALWYRSGWWIRRTSVVRFNKIQSVERGQSPFDRRWRMAVLRVDTAGAGRASHRLHVPFLETAVADRLLERLGREAGRRTFRW